MGRIKRIVSKSQHSDKKIKFRFRIHGSPHVWTLSGRLFCVCARKWRSIGYRNLMVSAGGWRVGGNPRYPMCYCRSISLLKYCNCFNLLPFKFIFLNYFIDIITTNVSTVYASITGFSLTSSLLLSYHEIVLTDVKICCIKPLHHT